METALNSYRNSGTGAKRVIFDLDGTLADGSHRIHHILGEEKDWDAYHSLCDDDQPIWSTIRMHYALDAAGYVTYVITGRNEKVRDQTMKWLRYHGVFYHDLFMRAEKDHRPDYVIKREVAMSAGFSPENTVAVFEDRKRVVEMWRTLGFQTYQVSEGEY